MINIDPQKKGIERYQMPQIQSFQLRNNKTYLKNLDKVSESLHRNPEQILKYIGFVLNTQINVKDISINGIYNNDKIQTMIYDFIKLYILCGVCGNPETQIINKTLQCCACGKSTPIIKGPDKYNKWLFK